MADPNSAQGLNSNAGNTGHFPNPGGPGPNPAAVGGKAGMMPSSYPYSLPGQPNTGPSQHNTMYSQPNSNQTWPANRFPAQPPPPNALPNQVGPGPGPLGAPSPGQGFNTSVAASRPPAAYPGPPGTFGAPPGPYRGMGVNHSATPPPTASSGLLTAPPQPALNRSSSTPSMPPAPGQFGAPAATQPMVNGLNTRPHGPPRPAMPSSQSQAGPGLLSGPSSNPMFTTGPPRQLGPPGNQPAPPMSSAPSIRHPMSTAGGNAPPPPQGMPNSQMMPPPPRAMAPHPNNTEGRPTELPLPYHGQGQYSHQIPGLNNLTTPGLTPNTSEPPSQKSSRAPSPVPGQKYDALEGQFTPYNQGGQTPQNSTPDQQTQFGGPPNNSVSTNAMKNQTPLGPSNQIAPPPGPSNPMVPHGQSNQIIPPPGVSNQITSNSGPSNQMPPPPSGLTNQMSPPLGAPNQFSPHGPPNMMPAGVPPNSHPSGLAGQVPPPTSLGGQVPNPSSLPWPQGPPSSLAATSQTYPSVSAPSSGVTGRRQYPQMPASYGSQTGQYPAGSTAPAQPGTVPNSAPGVAPQPGVPGYPANNTYPQSGNVAALNAGFNNMKLQPNSQRPVNLLQEKNILPPEQLTSPTPNLPADYKKAICSPEIFRCTLNCIPNTQSLLNKSRLPLGILIHPFKDLAQLPVIQSSVIVRCRSCRTYINPFVTFVDMRRWKCNLCYRTNELPEEFNYDPVSKTYGEPQRRPEIRSGTIEFIAPSEYMLRPPQPAVYLFVLDVSYNARETGYLQAFCQTLLDELDRLPGDARTQVGFLAFDRSLYFFNLAEGLSQPQLLVVSDTEEVFLPSPDNLLVNLQESRELVSELLNILPEMFKNSMETGSALGPALEAAYKLMSPTGGRVSVFQTTLPTVGNGSLKSREDPNERSGKKVQHLGPATDFYKRMALDCSAQQIGVDLFLLNSQYIDIASIGCVSKFSGGSINYFPAYHSVTNPPEAERFEGVLRRYLSRKIGFEAVMRIRCSRGLSIHTFHGNFFVRSTDLLSLPNVNPDAGFGMQMSIEDTIETNYVCFQAALLYTSSKGERRIRVHTIAIPVTQQLSEIHMNADQGAVVSLLAKMAVDKSLSSSLSDARDALINASIDMLGSYGGTLAASQRQGMLPCPFSLRLQPLFTLGLLKSLAFRVGLSTKVDERVYNMEACKNLPVFYLLMMIYPHLYPVHNLDDKNNVLSKEDSVIPQPPVLQLSAAYMDRHGAYLMDLGTRLFLWIGAAVSDQFCRDVLDKPNFSSIPDLLFELPELENPTSDLLRAFITHLNDQRPYPAPLVVMREDSRSRMHFLEHLIEDRTESSFSYYEFLQHLQKEVRS